MVVVGGRGPGDELLLDLPSEQWMVVADWLHPMDLRAAELLMQAISEGAQREEAVHCLAFPTQFRVQLDSWLAAQSLRLVAGQFGRVFAIAELRPPTHQVLSPLRALVGGQATVGASEAPAEPPPRRQVRLDVGPVTHLHPWEDTNVHEHLAQMRQARRRAPLGEVDASDRLPRPPRPGLLVRGWRFLVQAFGRGR